MGTKAFEHSSFLSLGFSLLNACLRVSQQRNEVRMKQKPTCYAGGVKWLYRKIIYNQLKEDIRDILKQLCAYKGVEIIEGHLMPDHIHMLVSIPPKMSV